MRYGILTEYTAYLVQEPTQGPNGRMPAAPAMMDAAARGGAGVAARQTGREAFQRAQASAGYSGVSNLAAADKVASARTAEIRADMSVGTAPAAVRRVGGRLFVRRDSIWTDAAHRDSLHVTRVAAFSDAYFALVRALPDLAPFLGVGDETIVAGRRASVRIGPEGVTAWRPGELEALVRNFRGA
jgi:hypothetical protein